MGRSLTSSKTSLEFFTGADTREALLVGKAPKPLRGFSSRGINKWMDIMPVG
jgi:hypothetical protein